MSCTQVLTHLDLNFHAKEKKPEDKSDLCISWTMMPVTHVPKEFKFCYRVPLEISYERRDLY